MRPSRTAGLFFAILICCFAIGFSMGAFPDRWRELQGEKAGPLSVLVSSPDLIPSYFFLEYEKTTGNRIELKVVESFHLFKTEAQNADLLFAPLSWLGQIPEKLKPLPSQTEFHELLSSDFISLKLKLDFFLPVLWKTEQKDSQRKLLIWGFATAHQSGEGTKDLLDFLLTNGGRLREWAQSVSPAFTLQDSNLLTDFPASQRAQEIRKVPLTDLVIDQ